MPTQQPIPNPTQPCPHAYLLVQEAGAVVDHGHRELGLASRVVAGGGLVHLAAVVPRQLLVPALRAGKQRQAATRGRAGAEGQGGAAGAGSGVSVGWKQGLLLAAARAAAHIRPYSPPNALPHKDHPIPIYTAHLWSGMTAEVRVTMPDTAMSLLMSAGLRSRMTLDSRRL